VRKGPSFVAVAMLFLAGCSGPAPDRGAEMSASITTDSARLAVDGGSIWYRVTGTGTGTPVILLHGGPGFSSYYLKSLEGLGSDRLVVRYDQLGGGKSYRAHQEHVASLVLGSAALDIPTWERHARELVKTLPDSMQKAIETREAEGNFTAPDYQAALMDFYGRYVWRHPVEADLDSTFATVNETIYGTMQGPSEFTITGTLKYYDATPFLPEIRIPVLYTVGEFDEANPETVQRFGGLTPGAKVVVIPGAAHITTWDNPQANLEAVQSFLRAVDGAR